MPARPSKVSRLIARLGSLLGKGKPKPFFFGVRGSNHIAPDSVQQWLLTRAAAKRARRAALPFASKYAKANAAR